MKKIVLMCAGGMSTSLLVGKMRQAAAFENFSCNISSHMLSEAADVGSGADIILLGPQAGYMAPFIKKACPGVPVEIIEMYAYGKMDGKVVLDFARNKMDWQ